MNLEGDKCNNNDNNCNSHNTKSWQCIGGHGTQQRKAPDPVKSD